MGIKDLDRVKGVRTILSVDGKVPNEAMASKYGMKYVHVPIRYKSITEDEVSAAMKSFHKSEGQSRRIPTVSYTMMMCPRR